MLKQTAPHEWEIVPTPFPKELKDESGTVLNLARIGFVYQGFDGNFHSFIRRYTYGKPKPVPEDYSFEELLVYGIEQSILIGYVHSHYDGQYNFLCELYKIRHKQICILTDKTRFKIVLSFYDFDI